MPGALTLFEEPVPLEAFGVREALDRELVVNTYRHSPPFSTSSAPHVVSHHRADSGRGGFPADFKYSRSLRAD